MLLKRFFTDATGVTLVEYGIAISLAVAVGAATLTTLADDIDTALTAAGAEMPGSN